MYKVIIAILLLVFASPIANAGAKIEVGEDKWFAVGLLLQPQVRFDENAAVAEDTWSIDPFVRRARIMAYGQFTKLVNFFVETDSPNFGKGGDYSAKMFIQDAYLEFNIHEAFQVDMGLILLPFSHHGMQGATSLLGLDYHSALIRHTPGGNFVWRDMGLMFRGMFLDKKLEYRLSVTNGVDDAYGYDSVSGPGLNPQPLNAFDKPKVTGRLTYNIFDAEGGSGVGGMFYDGLYLKHTGEKLISPKKIVSIGVSGQYQQDASYDMSLLPSDFYAFAADVFADFPLGDATQAINGQVNYYMYEYGEGNANTGMGLMAELGYRYNCLQPVLGFDWYDVKDTDIGDIMILKGGINYWILGHNANVKVEFGGAKQDGLDDWALYSIVQTQLVF